MGKSGAGESAGEFRVLVDNGEYWLRNRGDLAMMVITVNRIREHWPRARVGMLTDQPLVMRALLPDAEPLFATAGGHWGRSGLAGWVDQQASARVTGPAALHWRAATEVPKHHLRGVRNQLRDQVRALRGATPPEPPASGGIPELPPVPAALPEADLVIAQGGGYMTDVDLYQAHRTLNLLEAAQRQGIPNVMLGQGLGPMTDPELLRRCAEVLPGVDYIGLREGLQGPKLLADLGVAADRVLVTGDDAVEFSYRLRRPEIGTDLGLCLRISDYSKVSDTARDTLGEVMRAQAVALDTHLAPLIISEYDDEDRRFTLPLLAHAPKVRPVLSRAGSAQDCARQVSRCRILVTSAYHLAVFALSQGIPAVAVTASRYYDDKFNGLADMFGAGLRVVPLATGDLDTELTLAVRELWESAPELRDTLQQKAVEQIDAGRAGLDRVFRLVGGREGDRPADTVVPAQGE